MTTAKSPNMPPLAVVTMVYDDDVFLDIWLNYWEARLPRGNLFVLIHKDYAHYEAKLEGCNTLRIARPDMHVEFERDRWRMLSSFCSGLTYMFKRVIYTDVDEIVALDPEAGDDIVAHVLEHPDPVLSPFGVELVQNIELEDQSFDPSQPVLAQRKFIATHGMYSKPCMITEPIFWGSGGHYCDKEDIALSPDLVLFHLRLFDEGIYVSRAKQRRSMLFDQTTGKAMRGVGGPTWRSSENELTTFDVASAVPLDSFAFPEMRRRWNKPPVFDKNRGVWKRKGPFRKQLFHIPERFTALF